MTPARVLAGGGAARTFAALDRALVAVLHAGFAFILVAALLQVVTRYVLDSPLAWTEELSRLALIAYALLGSVTALATGRHPRMDDLVVRLPRRAGRAVAACGEAVVVACAWAIAVHGGRIAGRTVQVAASVDLPLSWIFGLLVASALLMIVYQARATAAARGAGAAAAVVALGIALYLAVALVPAPEMGGGAVTIILIGTLLLFLAIGTPVAFALAGAAMLAFWADPSVELDVLPQRIVGGMDSFLLIAIPFFLMAGEIMNLSGVTQRIIAIARALVGHMRGGLGQTNVVANFMMGGLSGSSSADCAALGKLMIPDMRKAGYGAPFAAATTASASILANLVPPSINLLIYGGLASVSVGALFLAGVIPAVIMSLAMMAVVWWYALRHRIPLEREGFSPAELGRALGGGIWALGLPAIIVLGIRLGVFTATEAAAVAVVYAALIAAVVYRRLPLRDLPEISRGVAEDTAVVLLIIACSSPFAWMLTVEQVPQQVASAMAPLVDHPWLLLLAINVLLLIVGLPLEPAPAMVILIPVLLPILRAAHVDLVHFGIIMVTNLFIGALTPPIGNLAFIAATVARERATAVFRALNPFMVALIAALLVITYLPAASLWLPRLLRP